MPMSESMIALASWYLRKCASSLGFGLVAANSFGAKLIPAVVGNGPPFVLNGGSFQIENCARRIRGIRSSALRARHG